MTRNVRGAKVALAMSWQPTLSSKLLTLRPLVAADWPALFEAASDPQIWSQHPEPLRYRRDVFEKFFASALASHAALVVEDASNGAVIGSSRYLDHRTDLRSVEIGYTFLARAYWGGPHNRELKTLMLDHAFDLVDTVWFLVGEHNLRSRGAMTKLGGKLEPASEAPVTGDVSGHVAFRIDRDSWRP